MRPFRMLAACECSGAVRGAFAARGWEAWSADVLPSETPATTFSKGKGWNHLGIGLRNHYQGDVRDLFSWEHPVNRGHYERRVQSREDGYLYPWDLVIAFPPCTHLSLAGAVWWRVKREPQLDQDSGQYTLPSLQDEAASFFMEMVNAPAPHVAVENPRGDMTRRYRAPDQYVQPHMFGDPLIKLTGLWLENLPLLTADNPVEPLPGGRVATGGGSWRVDIKNGHGPNNGHEDGKGRRNRQRERNRTLPGLARAMAAQWGSYVEEQHAE
jgi:hypothetical protein